MKTNYRKINIYTKRADGKWHYTCSTTWNRTCKDAVARWIESRGLPDIKWEVKARFAKQGEW